MTKVKHPSNRKERLQIKARKSKKDLHDNASPVYKLLKEKEALDAEGSKFNFVERTRLPRD